MINTFSDSFSAGETKTYTGGRFFLLFSVTDEVDIEFFTPEGTSLGVAVGMTSGFNVDMLEPTSKQFGFCKITSATVQTIKVIIGDSRAQIFKTSTEINGGNLDPWTLGASKYERYSASTAVNTIVTPAANVNGIELITALCGSNAATAYNGGECRSTLMAKTSAPSGITDTTAHRILFSNNGITDSIRHPIIIPAGMGLYEVSDHASIKGLVSVTYNTL